MKKLLDVARERVARAIGASPEEVRPPRLS
jgi:hypothetical protein